MRALLVIVGLVALVVVGLISLGLLQVHTSPGALPSVKLEGGRAPEVKADMATLSVGMKEKKVDVPTVTTTEKTIAVPSVSLNKPADGNSSTDAN